MFHWILPSLALLAVLGLSYLARLKTSPAKIGFTAWCVSLQFFLIGMLGTGLIHTHLGCPYLLGDCYVEGYPHWLEYIQIALVFLCLRMVACGGLSIFNQRLQRYI